LNFIYKHYECQEELAEEEQTQQITMAFAIKNGTAWTNKTAFVHCRDFLTDTLVMDITKQNFIIYNYQYEYEKTKDTTQNLYLVLNLPTTELVYLQKNIHYLHTLETYHNLPKTKLTKLTLTNLTEDPTVNFDIDNNIILVKANKFWKSHTVSLSLYTAFLRALTHNLPKDTDVWSSISKLREGFSLATDARIFDRILTNKTWKSNFIYLINNLTEVCHKIDLKNYVLEIKNLEAYKYRIHDNLGFYACCQNLNPSLTLNTKIIAPHNNNNKDMLCQEDVKAVIPS
jgi:hypothetical protein